MSKHQNHVPSDVRISLLFSYNKRFTNQVTRSVLEIRSPHFHARTSQARAVRKGSGFVFPSTERVINPVSSSLITDRNLKLGRAVEKASKCWKSELL